MLASIARICVLIALIASGVVFYPKYKPVLEPIIGKPKILGAQILHPAIKTINDFLPDSLQIPVPTQSDRPSEAEASEGQVKGAVSQIIGEVKSKAADLAEEQIDSAKGEATKAFCQILIEKIKAECGL